MSIFKIGSPLEWRYLTQSFANKAERYSEYGGHAGTDWRADSGTPVYSVCNGRITDLGAGARSGNYIVLTSEVQEDGESDENHITGRVFDFIYNHLSSFGCSLGERVLEGTPIGYSGVSGLTSGAHLDIMMRPFIYDNGTSRMEFDVKDKLGCVDIIPYFKDNQINWLPADARYGRRKEWSAEFYMRFKNAWLHRYFLKTLKRHPLSIAPCELHALVYGGWGADEVFNPAMRGMWLAQTKAAFLNKEKPPIRI